jgi:hypothetical protein
VALLTKGSSEIEKATVYLPKFKAETYQILPRGFALGFVRYLPGMDKVSMSRTVCFPA